MLPDPNWITEDDADVIMSMRALKASRGKFYTLEQVLRENNISLKRTPAGFRAAVSPKPEQKGNPRTPSTPASNKRERTASQEEANGRRHQSAPTLINRRCSYCGKHIKVRVRADGSYTGGDYFGKLRFKPDPSVRHDFSGPQIAAEIWKHAAEDWECPACAKIPILPLPTNVARSRVRKSARPLRLLQSLPPLDEPQPRSHPLPTRKSSRS